VSDSLEASMMKRIGELKAENARLRALDSLKTISLTDSPTWQAIGAYAEVKEENARLKAEVERLTKAGDAMHCFLIGYIVENRLSSSYLNKLDDGWVNAREVQS
jgi:uncharacterized small protein (DUF1192 family)